jgi:hypothetical protein
MSTQKTTPNTASSKELTTRPANQSFETCAPCWLEHNTLRQIDVHFTDVCHETAYGSTVRLSFAVRVF